ncbi:MAG TPA: hypothetical protein VK506_15840 [Conexibacter sp.]|nr:hypothetical protein [Conexibacter sp.]
MSDFVSRGFTGRRRVPEDLARRLPPVETEFPVLTAGPIAGTRCPTSDLLLAAGLQPSWIRTERFGPTG